MVDLIFGLNLDNFWWFTFSCGLLYVSTLEFRTGLPARGADHNFRRAKDIISKVFFQVTKNWFTGCLQWFTFLKMEFQEKLKF